MFAKKGLLCDTLQLPRPLGQRIAGGKEKKKTEEWKLFTFLFILFCPALLFWVFFFLCVCFLREETRGTDVEGPGNE